MSKLTWYSPRRRRIWSPARRPLPTRWPSYAHPQTWKPCSWRSFTRLTRPLKSLAKPDLEFSMPPYFSGGPRGGDRLPRPVRPRQQEQDVAHRWRDAHATGQAVQEESQARRVVQLPQQHAQEESCGTASLPSSSRASMSLHDAHAWCTSPARPGNSLSNWARRAIFGQLVWIVYQIEPINWLFLAVVVGGHLSTVVQ